MSSINNIICHCPIKGCNSKIGPNSDSYCDHICSNHKSLADKFDLFNGRANFISICNVCPTRRFVKGFHYHCGKCPVYFHKRQDLTNHLKEKHRRDYLETPCKKGLACEGFDDGKVCGFTHFDVVKFPRFASSEPGVNFTCDEDYIDDQHLQYGICPNEKPWNDIRCQSTTCEHNHYRGRVKFLIQARNRARTNAVQHEPIFPVSSEVINEDAFPGPPPLVRLESEDAFPGPPPLVRLESEDAFLTPPPLVRLESEDAFPGPSVLMRSQNDELLPILEEFESENQFSSPPALVRLVTEILPRNINTEFESC